MDHSMTSGFQPGIGTPVWSPDLTPTSEPAYIGALVGLFVLSIAFRGLVAAQGYLEAYLHIHYYPRGRPSHGSGSRLASGRGQPPIPNPLKQPLETSPHTLQGSLEAVDDRPKAQLPRTEKSDDTIETSASVTPTNDSVMVSFSAGGDERLQQPLTPGRSTGVSTDNEPPRYGALSPLTVPPFTLHGSFSPLPTVQPFVWQAELSRAVLTTAVIALGYLLMLVVMTYNSAYFGVILAGVFVGDVYFARWGRARPIFQPSSSGSGSHSSGREAKARECAYDPKVQQDSLFIPVPFPSGSTPGPSQSVSGHVRIPSSAAQNSSLQQQSMLHPYPHHQENNGASLSVASFVSSASTSSTSRRFSTMMPSHGGDGAC
ncbi:hypothetical protein BGW38_000138 [Lunasporangiospora selenospora]|uniref:Copper transport protein n=1 Tax=Lunasporangiospora selenospora TaxID=979761 RepID=A0A9P6FVA4_9FUNG|nr:hypothetical protein BGW38_000138 [Lunasporangiospora selenospora]